MTKNLPTIKVFKLPSEAKIAKDSITGSCSVVIDVLRSTTTLTYAFSAGLLRVIPVLRVEDAFCFRDVVGAETILGGERECKRIPQFNVGNSPSEMVAEVVKNKTMIFTSTNGTLAMIAAKSASRLFLGSFANVSALCVELLCYDRVVLVCSGTCGVVTSEDVLLAGLIVSKLKAANEKFTLDKTAEFCLETWNLQSNERDLLANLQISGGAKKLLQIGLDNDIKDAAKCDSTNIVPEIKFNEIDYSILGEPTALDYL